MKNILIYVFVIIVFAIIYRNLTGPELIRQQVDLSMKIMGRIWPLIVGSIIVAILFIIAMYRRTK